MGQCLSFLEKKLRGTIVQDTFHTRKVTNLIYILLKCIKIFENAKKPFALQFKGTRVWGEKGEHIHPFQGSLTYLVLTLKIFTHFPKDMYIKTKKLILSSIKKLKIASNG